ncbi:hypothetical protein MXB_4680 [Myxobolus squamalis]|nr:hypothetical protein MXB_4680 [Myxobolus squamalis]
MSRSKDEKISTQRRKNFRTFAGELISGTSSASLVSTRACLVISARVKGRTLSRIQKSYAKLVNNARFSSSPSSVWSKASKKVSIHPEIFPLYADQVNKVAVVTEVPDLNWLKSEVTSKSPFPVSDVLNGLISDDEIYSVSRYQRNWSSPGPDGIQPFFWKRLKHCRVILRFFANCFLKKPSKIPVEFFSGLTYLIPKKDSVVSIEDVRPITCLNACL